MSAPFLLPRVSLAMGQPSGGATSRPGVFEAARRHKFFFVYREMAVLRTPRLQVGLALRLHPTARDADPTERLVRARAVGPWVEAFIGNAYRHGWSAARKLVNWYRAQSTSWSVGG